MNSTRRQARVAVALWCAVIFLVGALVGAGPTAGQEAHRAGLVVSFADGRTERRCVEFEEEEITGVELLRRSGLAAVFTANGPYGEGVCSIDGTGCTNPGNCFCQCQGTGCAFWAYFALRDEGGWRFAQTGPSQRRLEDGDVDGWIWGSGRVPPPDVSFGEICPLLPPDEVTAPRETEIAATSTPEATREARSGMSGGATSATVEVPTMLSEPSATAAAGGRDGGGSKAGAVEGVGDRGDDGGLPVGLIAFGAVAGALALGTGAYALRRRSGG